MNRERWLRTRSRLKREGHTRRLHRAMNRDLFFGERGPEQFARGGVVAGAPGPELVTLLPNRMVEPDAE